MKSHRVIFCLLAAALAAAPAWSADEPAGRTYRLQWRDLDRMIRGHRISLVLPSGIKLRGDVISVGSDELRLDVRKTSNKQAYPKGYAVVPRPEVTGVRLFRKQKHHTWRTAGTAIGAGIGVGIAIPLGTYLHNESGNSAGAAALAVAIPAGLGYLLGWSADRSDAVDIMIVPER